MERIFVPPPGWTPSLGPINLNQAIQVDTNGITATYSTLSSVNENITNDFTILQNVLKPFIESWQSSAGATAETKMYELFNLNPNRSSEMKDYIDTLKLCVNPNYKEAERVNISLADNFR